MRSIWRPGPEPQKRSMATYLGENEAGHPCWEIDGQTYTGSVSTVGGGTPTIGRVYPAWCNQPDSRSQWVALVRPGASKILPKDFTEAPLWTHYLATAGRTGRSAWTATELERILSIEAAFADPDLLVRVWENLIIFDVFGNGGFLALATFGQQYFSFEYPSYFAADNPLRDLVLDASEDGNLFILGATSVEKVERATVTQEWVEALGEGPAPGGDEPYNPLALTLHLASAVTLEGEEEPTDLLAICLSSKPHETIEDRPSLYLHRLSRVTGNPVSDPIRLVQQADAPFAEGEIVPIVSSWTANPGAAALPCYWDPSALGADPVYTDDLYEVFRLAVKPTYDRTSTQAWVPWARIGDIISNQYSPPIFPESPTEKVTLASALHLGVQTPEDPEDPAPEVMTYPANVLLALYESGVIIPKFDKPASSLVAYRTDTGAAKWETVGWSAPPVDGLHTRRFFTPLLIRRGAASVCTRVAKFLDVTVDRKEYITETYTVPLDPEDPQSPEDIWAHTTGLDNQENIITGPSPADPTSRVCRPCIAVEDRLEGYSLQDGALISSVALQPIKITSMEHRPGAFSGEDPGTWQVYDAAEDEFFEHPFADRPARREASDFWYSKRFLTPEAYAGVDSRDSDTLLDADTAESAVDPRAWLVDQDGFIYWDEEPDSPRVYEKKFAAVLMETQADAPLLFDKLNPVLSSGGSLLIFPPKVYSSVMYDGNTMVLQGAKRSWEESGTIDETAGVTFSGGGVGNGWLHDVTMGPDWNKTKRWFYAFHRDGSGLAWRYDFTYDTTKTLTLARPCCGDGKVYIYYRIGTGSGSHRLRILSEADGSQLDDYALTIESGLSPGTPRSIILCGNVSVIVTADSIFSVLPPE